MTNALIERPGAVATVEITNDQIALIKKTVAKGATDDELQLFFFDCQRRGVHPLDKKIHFTKRRDKDGSYKYTPIVGIDFLRERAAETGQCLGISDPVFSGKPKKDDFTATVTVKRLVAGHIAEFTATARWPEYCPSSGMDFMWQKMGHGQLGKCAEALALRKAFPGDESGALMTGEELDQQREPEMNLGKAMTAEFPPDTDLAGRLLRIEEPVSKGDPATAKIEMPDGVMAFQIFQLDDGWMELEGQPIIFRYVKQGKFRVIAEMREEGQLVEPTREDVSWAHKQLQAKTDSQEEIIDTEDDAVQVVGIDKAEDDSDDWQHFSPGKELLGLVTAHTPRKGNGPHRLTIACADRDVQVDAWKSANEFDPGLASYDEVVDRQVIFKACEGKVYRGEQQYGLESLTLDPLATT